jgi:hypothetical protein
MALVLGAMISRLSTVIGSGPAVRARGGAPAGYDGIASRGTYDRLLPVEWLLQDAMPDEFLRRAVSGEHSFLRRAHTRGAAGRRCVVLFDAGPEQLGAPRIAHLALLILLAQRAEAQRGALEWGVLQQTDAPLNTAVTRYTVRGLLRARTSRCMSSADLDRWLAFTMVQGTESELWLIGAENVVPLAALHRASAVTVSDVLEPGTPRRLRVRAASTQKQRTAEAVLEVPDDRVAVQLLRDPFSVAVASRSTAGNRLDLTSNLLFAPDGRRLYVRGTGSTLIALQLPNSLRAPPGRTVTFAAPEGHSILAVGRSYARKRTLVLTQNASELLVHVLTKRAATVAHTERFVDEYGHAAPSARATDLLPLGCSSGQRLCFIGHGGHLFELENGKVQFRDRASAMAVRAVSYGLAWVSVREGVPRLMHTSLFDEKIMPEERKMAATPPAIHGLHAPHFCEATFPLLAYPTSASLWSILHVREIVSLAVSERSRVVGVVIQRGQAHHETGLVVLDEARTRLELLWSGGATDLLATTDAPIVATAVCGAGRRVAFMTEAAEVGVYSCLSKGMVLRVGGGGSS